MATGAGAPWSWRCRAGARAARARSRLGTTRINGSLLTVNPGNGWTGVTGTLLYAAYRYSTRHAMQDELVALSAGRGLLRPRERRLWLPGAATPAPTLLSASAINITGTSFRPRVTFTR